MKKEEKLVKVDKVLVGAAKFKTNDKNDIADYNLTPKLLNKVNTKARHRWENGGNVIYEKLQSDPDFALSEEYSNYFLKKEIPIDLPF